jgi:hypothetical protein
MRQAGPAIPSKRSNDSFTSMVLALMSLLQLQAAHRGGGAV